MVSAVMMVLFGVSIFQKTDAFLQILGGMDQNEQGNTDGEDGVNENKIGEAHNNGADQHDCPAQHILQHMQADCSLVQGISAVGEPGGTEIDTDPHNGETDHAVIVDLHRVEDPSDSVADDQKRTQKQERGHQDTAEQRGSAVVVFAPFFENIGKANGCGIAYVVDSIRKNGNAASQDAACKFKNRKCHI